LIVAGIFGSVYFTVGAFMEGTVDTLSFALFVPALTTLNEVCVYLLKQSLKQSGNRLSWAVAVVGLGLTTLTVLAANMLLSGLDFTTKVTGSIGIVLQALVHLMGQLRLLEQWLENDIQHDGQRNQTDLQDTERQVALDAATEFEADAGGGNIPGEKHGCLRQ
jgi:hypothetical protein